MSEGNTKTSIEPIKKQKFHLIAQQYKTRKIPPGKVRIKYKNENVQIRYFNNYLDTNDKSEL